eukprot:2289332-Amphidinium_carterae.1
MEDFQGNQEADVVANFGAVSVFLTIHPLTTFSGRWLPKRSDTSGFWLDRSCVRDLKLLMLPTGPPQHATGTSICPMISRTHSHLISFANRKWPRHYQ